MSHLKNLWGKEYRNLGTPWIINIIIDSEHSH